MVCRLFGTKPLPDPMLFFCQMNPLEESVNRYSNVSIQENVFQNVVCKMAAILSRSQCVNPNSSPPFLLQHLVIYMPWCTLDLWTLVNQVRALIIWFLSGSLSWYIIFHVQSYADKPLSLPYVDLSLSRSAPRYCVPGHTGHSAMWSAILPHAVL